MAGGLAAVAAAAGGVPVWAAGRPAPISRGSRRRRRQLQGHQLPQIDKKWQKQVVKYFSSEPQGDVVVDTITTCSTSSWRTRRRSAMRTSGSAAKASMVRPRRRIDRQGDMAQWTPPPEMLERRPELPPFVAGGASDNPLGARAMSVLRDGVGAAITCMVRWSRGMSVRTPRVAAFA